MIRKTMRIGEIRTSIKLEPEFWEYLREVAQGRRLRLSHLVNDVAEASPDRTNLASTLRTFCLLHARLQLRAQADELEKLQLGGSTQDLSRAIEACPLPCLVLSDDRSIRRANRAFSQWLNLDTHGIVGQRLDNVMILRAPGMRELWSKLYSGHARRGSFNATYVSPGIVRTAQAVAVGLSPDPTGAHKAALILFETLAMRA